MNEDRGLLGPMSKQLLEGYNEDHKARSSSQPPRPCWVDSQQEHGFATDGHSDPWNHKALKQSNAQADSPKRGKGANYGKPICRLVVQ